MKRCGVRILFQSRNRDACHFRAIRLAKYRIATVFQSRNRDACHFRVTMATNEITITIKFQSRNRDACHFRTTQWTLPEASLIVEFQSRNRDACHFRISTSSRRCWAINLCFNLAIEMLVISGHPPPVQPHQNPRFNLAIEMLVISGCLFHPGRGAVSVSISQSRCLSFQETETGMRPLEHLRFQSRNRDACHFRAKESRLGGRAYVFQSRNRDACHFRSANS